MKIYLGLTDTDWFTFLKDQPAEDINFWRPSSQQTFKALKPGEPFLFKLKQQKDFTEEGDYIGGVAFFHTHALLPISEAWRTFGIYNGMQSFGELNERMRKYRHRNQKPFEIDPTIGCIVLTNPVFFDKKDWIPVPNWAKSIQQGKVYSTREGDGLQMWDAVQDQLEHYQPDIFEPPRPAKSENLIPKKRMVADGGVRYGERKVYVRSGQGAFRLMVTDHYQQHCAITGESALPVLEAAHIQPVTRQGQHVIQNGLLLRSDLHRLLDTGYITISPDYRVHVSPRLSDNFTNHGYAGLHQRPLQVLPENAEAHPAREFLDWHQEHVFQA